jgi:dTDP-4-dehydrorhamnose 3,5-epimerase
VTRTLAESIYSMEETTFRGVCVLRPRVHEDARGSFIKVMHETSFASLGLPTVFRELFVTRSRPGVVRGLHYQAPPVEQGKLVTCLDGKVLDVVLDIRRGSPTYGHHIRVWLDADEALLVYIPPGFAHGFAVEAGSATMLYGTTAVHDPSCDEGVRWDSAGIDWPANVSIVSERDQNLPELAAFHSPFGYERT